MQRLGRNRRWFLAGLALAHVGVFIGMAPLLHILVPLKAQAIDAGFKEAILSTAVFYGAITAAVSNLLWGALSDRTRSRWGRRRPWLAFGALGTIGAYGVIAAAHDAPTLIAGVVLFQAAYNMMLAALLALFAERAPERTRGALSAVFGMSYPLANMVGAVLIGGLLTDEGLRFGVLAAVILVSAGPLALLAPDPSTAGASGTAGGGSVARPARPRPAGRAWRPGLGPFASRAFVLAWLGRFLTTFGFVMVSIYLLYFIDQQMRLSPGQAGQRPEAGLSLLTALSFGGVIVVSALVLALPWLARRRRALLVLGAGLLAVAAAALAAAQGWLAIVSVFVVYGCGMGGYFAMEMALLADVLPSAGDRGRDLGVINLAAVLPQALAPVAALAMTVELGLGYRALFATAAAAFLCAAIAFSALPARKPDVLQN